MLRDGHLINPPPEGNCPIDNLSDDLLSYVFQIGVEIKQEEEDEVPEWRDWKDVDDYGPIVDSTDSTSSQVLSQVSDSDSDSDNDSVQHRDTLPSQVLVSHVCRRWRSVALDTHLFWTTLTFRMRPGLAQMKEYISRSNGLPLTIDLDCYTAEYIPPDVEELQDEELIQLSFEDLDQILDLLEPAISQWRKFIFYSKMYSYLLFLMSRLDKLPAAPCLESFKVHHIWDGVEREPPEYNTPYLPFNGQAPNLKEAVFWGIHIDWERSLPMFLRGLRVLELSYPGKDAWPTYAAFTEIIKNSPELCTLTLSNTGPVLADGVPFDSQAAWGPVPLAIPSLTKLVLQFHDQEYAIALVQHLDIPNVTHLVLNFDTQDHSDLLQALAKPVKGRYQSLLRQITHLNMTGFSFDSASMKVLLSESTSLKCLNLQPPRREEKVIGDALANPGVLAIGTASVDLPKLFCPKLEEISTSFDDEWMKALIIARRDAGVPLKRIRRLAMLLP